MQRRSLVKRVVGSLLLSVGSAGIFAATASLDAAPVSADATGTCSQPVFPAGTPAPTSVTGPSQPSSLSLPVIALGSGGAIEILSPVCQWVFTFDPPTGDPTVTFTQYSNLKMTLATQYGVSYTNNTGVSCHFTAEVLNGFGGGGAQETLNSSNCNTDGYVPGEGSVQSTLVNSATGPVSTVASFSSTVTSFASGANVSYGFFNACSENPVGSHTNYACNYFYGGPSL